MHEIVDVGVGKYKFNLVLACLARLLGVKSGCVVLRPIADRVVHVKAKTVKALQE